MKRIWKKERGENYKTPKIGRKKTHTKNIVKKIMKISSKEVKLENKEEDGANINGSEKGRKEKGREIRREKEHSNYQN